MVFWQDLTWDEVKESLGKIKAVILPIGSCEQHSLHLPLGMDTYSSLVLSEKIAKELKGAVYVLPPIWYGVSPHHMNFSGTITISPETLISITVEIAKSLKRHGLKRLIIINGHGGNVAALSIALRKIREEVGIDAVLVNPWELIGDVIKELLESKVWGHACEFETSVAMVEIPDKVRIEKIKKPKIKEPRVTYFAIWEQVKAIIPWNTDEFTDTGSIGDPTKATREKGEKLFNAIYERTLDFTKKFIED